jgi:two-component system cell cycle response regulator
MAALILVIEDNPDNMSLMVYLLQAYGYEPLQATDGAEGVRTALEAQPDLILLDLRMPRMDGYEAVDRIRGYPELEKTRVVAVTASAMVDDLKRISGAGFDGYIRKPITPETFVGQAEEFLPEELRTRREPTGASP